MTDATVLRLAAALSDVARRREAAERLAHHVGADVMLLLVRDEDAGVLAARAGICTNAARR